MMLSEQFTFTKRQLGVVLLVLGAAAVIGLLLLDVVFVGREGGIGPAQRLAIITALATAFIGLTLIPLGDPPA